MNTNVAIPDEQMEKIRAISAQTGISEADLVRHGIDLMIAEKRQPTGDWREAVHALYGMWKDRDDIDDLIREGREQLKARDKRLYGEPDDPR